MYLVLNRNTKLQTVLRLYTVIEIYQIKIRIVSIKLLLFHCRGLRMTYKFLVKWYYEMYVIVMNIKSLYDDSYREV